MNLKTATKTLALATLGLLASSATAQDLLARKAPVDVHMKSVKSVAISNTIEKADLNNPAANFYTNWDSRNLRGSKGFIPRGTRIDLRGFAMPTDNRKVNSNFGRRWGRQHEGIDVKVYIGDTIRAAFDGKVRIRAYNGRGYGYYIVIRHTNGLETLYGHMSRQLVDENEVVRAGQPIGLGGNTGRSTGSHLHFEVRLCSTPIDPALIFDFANQDVRANYYVTTKNYGDRSLALATAQRIESENEQAAETAASAQLAATASPEQAEPAAAVQEEPAAAAVAPRATTSRRSRRATRNRYTTVKKGDTLYNIARRNGTTVKALCRKNGISANKTLRPGQRINL